MDKQVKVEYAYKIAMDRITELQKSLILKEALISQYEDEINKLTTLLNKYLNQDREVE